MNRPSQTAQPKVLATLPGASPNVLDAIHLNAYLEYAVGDYEEASDILNGAIQRHPEETAYHFDLGLTRWKVGDYDGAIACFAHAAGLDPGFADAFYNAGAAAARAGKKSEANTYFRQARRADISMALRCASDVVRRISTGKQPTVLERYGWRIPTKDFPAVLDAISYGLMKRGKREEAVDLLHRALALEVTAKRHGALGTVYESMKKHAEARRHFEIALDLEKKSP
jgi:tetratricopeptide (TPR) repeat protein